MANKPAESATDLAALAELVRDHSIFSPSGSAMWLNCSGSLIPNILAPDDAGEDAAYGTVAHGVAERWLKSGTRPSHLVGTQEFIESGDWGFLITIDEDMLDHVQRYVDWCSFLEGDHYVETKVYFSHLTPLENQGGTADHVACTYQRMVITDLKMGKGVPVFAEGNTQGMLYALGFFYEYDWLYDFQEFVIRIAQPRLDSFTEWTVSRSELLEFAEYVRGRAAAAWQIGATRTPSPKACQWCKVSGSCAANAMLQVELTEGIFDGLGRDRDTAEMQEFKSNLEDGKPLAFKDVDSLTVSEMAKLYAYRLMAEKWWDSLGERLTTLAVKEGIAVPGMKVVEGRSRRVFASKTKAVQRLVELGVPRDAVVREVTCSPAEAEELLRKAGHKRKDLPSLMADLVRRPPGKPTLAFEGDRREPITDVSESVFGDTTG